MHGLQGADDEGVPAAVFAQKLGALVRGLRAADAALNGKSRHDYVITDLRMGSAIVELRELRPHPAHLIPPTSGIEAFDICVEAVQIGKVDEAQRFGATPKHIQQLARGSGNKFGYGELWLDRDQPLRVDEFLFEQSRKFIEGPRFDTYLPTRHKWYSGIAHGIFDGVVKGVDLRGALPEVKLVLTAGGRQIDCIFRNVEIEAIRHALDRRVRVEGTAYYDGSSGLPRRLEVNAIHSVAKPRDFTRWRGTFEPFVAPDWDDDLEHE